jgi:hypothetical protein
VDGVNQAYPEDSIHSYVGKWWTTRDERTISRGRLLRAFVPFVGQEPLQLVAQGRVDPQDHGRAQYTVEPLRIGAPRRAPRLPVAALPANPGEVRAVYLGKVRPVLVVSSGGPEVPRVFRLGAARWQSTPSILVAPSFGVAADGSRGGWRPEFVERIRKCEYPQYIWDRLPLPGTGESVIRLDHTQPISRHPDSYEWTPHHLTDPALSVLEEWLTWLTTGGLPADGVLAEIRAQLLKD